MQIMKGHFEIGLRLKDILVICLVNQGTNILIVHSYMKKIMSNNFISRDII